MAFHTLCTAFRRIAIDQRGKVPIRCYLKGQAISDKNSNVLTSLISNTNGDVYKINFNFNVKFTPRALNIDLELPRNNGIYQNIVDIPNTRISIIENPNKYIPVKHDLPLPNKPVELPTNENIIEKQAVHMIIIRRRKMKKHQRKKLRKRMKFVWRKLKQKRELLKERNFQTEQVELIKQSESFDPAKYVAEKLEELDKEFIPRTYRGEVIPQDMIKKFIDEKKRRVEARLNRPRLTL